jgi:hypothetical protein
LFLRNEDYQAAPKEHLQAVMKFLGEWAMPDLIQIQAMPQAKSYRGWKGMFGARWGAVMKFLGEWMSGWLRTLGLMGYAVGSREASFRVSV